MDKVIEYFFGQGDGFGNEEGRGYGDSNGRRDGLGFGFGSGSAYGGGYGNCLCYSKDEEGELLSGKIITNSIRFITED